MYLSIGKVHKNVLKFLYKVHKSIRTQDVDEKNTKVYNKEKGGNIMVEREKQYKGNISYKKLFLLMDEKKIKKKDLREIYKISPTIINRLNNNSNVAVDTIMYLCEILNCQPGDIIEYIPDDWGQDKTSETE